MGPLMSLFFTRLCDTQGQALVSILSLAPAPHHIMIFVEFVGKWGPPKQGPECNASGWWVVCWHVRGFTSAVGLCRRWQVSTLCPQGLSRVLFVNSSLLCCSWVGVLSFPSTGSQSTSYKEVAVDHTRLHRERAKLLWSDFSVC